jgi:hypothetical protein
MFFLLMVYAATLALVTVGGLVITRAGVQSAHFAGSAAGVTACVVAVAALTVALVSGDLLAT